MEEGSFRCDANISVRRTGDMKLGTRCELKNLNSFRFIEKALHFEIARQIELIQDGGQVTQETRLYDSAANLTRPMRGKEDAHDYRYFPDPDLPPLTIDEDLLATVQEELPELPDDRYSRFLTDYMISASDAGLLTSDRELADYFEQTVSVCKDSRSASNWIMGELMGYLNRDKLHIRQSRVTPVMLGDLIININNNNISAKIGKGVFDRMWSGEGTPTQIIKKRNLGQISDSGELEKAIDEVIKSFSGQVTDYHNGQHKIFGFLVGKVMQLTQGKANPTMVTDMLKKKLSS